MLSKLHFTLAMLILCGLGVNQQADAAPGITVELPFLDYPFNGSNGYTFPSMQQSLKLSKGFYDLTHQRIAGYFAEKPKTERLATIGFDVLSLWLPLGSAWLHEEWHRAVMSNRRIHSYDEIYDFNLFAETVSVSHVSDDDLIRLKQLYPADMVRLHAAGMEAQNELNVALEQDIFFQGRRSFVDALLWLNNLNNSSYLYTCASNDANRITQDLLDSEGSNIPDRDFTGLDCNAWVYDLFRPNEPYSARGIHPSGNGIKRYIKYDDLSDAEKDYLHNQLALSFLSLVNPILYHRDHFTATNPLNGRAMSWNFALRHYLTSFGYSIDIDLLAQQAQHRLIFTVHNYVNHDRYFPGVSLAFLQHPVTAWGIKMSVTPRLDLWLQPEQQQFETSKGKPGGLVSLKLARPFNKRLDSFIELEAKTDGWVAGNVYLDDNVSVRLGLIAHLR